MKLLFSLMVLIAITLHYTSGLTDEQNAKFEKFSKPCREESGLTLEEVQKFRNGETIPDTPKTRKQLMCLTKKVGVSNESGEIVVDRVRQLVKNAVGDEEVDSIINKCVVTKNSPAETMISLTNCLRKNEVLLVD